MFSVIELKNFLKNNNSDFEILAHDCYWEARKERVGQFWLMRTMKSKIERLTKYKPSERT